jgi:hypothetical protein
LIVTRLLAGETTIGLPRVTDPAVPVITTSVRGAVGTNGVNVAEHVLGMLRRTVVRGPPLQPSVHPANRYPGSGTAVIAAVAGVGTVTTH